MMNIPIITFLFEVFLPMWVMGVLTFVSVLALREFYKGVVKK